MPRWRRRCRTIERTWRWHIGTYRSAVVRGCGVVSVVIAGTRGSRGSRRTIARLSASVSATIAVPGTYCRSLRTSIAMTAVARTARLCRLCRPVGLCRLCRPVGLCRLCRSVGLCRGVRARRGRRCGGSVVAAAASSGSRCRCCGGWISSSSAAAVATASARLSINARNCHCSADEQDGYCA